MKILQIAYGNGVYGKYNKTQKQTFRGTASGFVTSELARGTEVSRGAKKVVKEAFQGWRKFFESSTFADSGALLTFRNHFTAKGLSLEARKVLGKVYIRANGEYKGLVELQKSAKAVKIDESGKLKFVNGLFDKTEQAKLAKFYKKHNFGENKTIYLLKDGRIILTDINKSYGGGYQTHRSIICDGVKFDIETMIIARKKGAKLAELSVHDFSKQGFIREYKIYSDYPEYSECVFAGKDKPIQLYTSIRKSGNSNQFMVQRGVGLEEPKMFLI